MGLFGGISGLGFRISDFKSRILGGKWIGLDSDKIRRRRRTTTRGTRAGGRGLVLGCVGIGMEGGDISDCRCSFLCKIYIYIHYIYPELRI